MKPDDFAQLLAELKKALACNPHARFAILGSTPEALDIIAYFRTIGAEGKLLGTYSGENPSADCGLRPLAQLSSDRPDFVIVASDEGKEALLEEAARHLPPTSEVLLAGYAHFEFNDHIFNDLLTSNYLQSLANGYPNTLIHLYQVLANAARLKLQGVIVEFGMFKGGTTLLLSRFVEKLGQSWHVIGFDSFDGFPTRRSVLDMYAHPGCIFRDEAIVRRCVSGRDIEIVSGDIVETARRLRNEKIVAAFIDTDNYSSANAALDAVQEAVVQGGAIVFDHFTGRNRFKYTLGERIAAKRLLGDMRYFNLHDTGVFIRQR